MKAKESTLFETQEVLLKCKIIISTLNYLIQTPIKFVWGLT